MPLFARFVPRRVALPVAEFGSYVGSPSDGTAQTISGLAFNAAASDRYIVAAVALMGGSVNSLSSVTIGGISATIITSGRTSAATNTVVGLAIAAVPTETSGNVVATGNASSSRAAAATWSLTGLNSGTATASAQQLTTGDPMSTTINVSAGGIMVAMAAEHSGSARTAVLTGVAEDFDNFNFGDGSGNMNGGHQQYSSAQTGLTVQVDWSASPNGGALLAAAFR